MKRLARLAIFVALAFVFFRLEIPYPVPNYEFLKLDLGEAFLLLGHMAIPLRRFAYGTHGVGFSGLLNRLKPCWYAFQSGVHFSNADSIPLPERFKTKWILVPAVRTSVMVLFNWVLHPCCGAPHAYASSLHSHWRNTSELVAGLPKLGCGRNVSKVLTESHQRYCDLSRTPVPF